MRRSSEGTALENAERSVPSRWRYALGTLLSAAGIAVFVVLQINSASPDIRMILPGSQQIELEKGNYTLFYEHTTVISGSQFATDPTVPGILFFVMAPDESGVELETPSVNKRYEFDGRAGYSVINFAIDSPGTYTVGGGYSGGPAGSIFIFALGKSTSGPLLIAVLSIVGGLGVGVALLVSTFVMRRPSRL